MKKALSLIGWLLLWLTGPLVFLLAAGSSGPVGFPLDDAWIHQTYARSLANGLGWTYAGGPSSAGSTSPLWTVLQIPAFWLQIPSIIWSCGMGVLLLLANAVLVMLWIRKLDKRASRCALVFCLGEWHLIWAALSGMETILYCAWTALVFLLVFPFDSKLVEKPPTLAGLAGLGVIAGMGIWIRPEAILLSGLAFLAVIIQKRPATILRLAGLFLGLAAPVILYFVFTYRLNGRLLPNTFFVKTTEYAELTSTGLFVRLLQPWLPLLAGPFAVLMLLIPAALLSAIRERKWIWVLPFCWALAHLTLYAIQLPATYQHGRYFIPILPVLMGYGVYGFFRLRAKWDSSAVFRIVSRALWISAILLTAIFMGIGARQFSRDVGIIETEMVAVSKWIRANTPSDTIVAAHDIGALGFFGERRIIDLGGVTDLDAVDLLSGKVPLKAYLRQKEADLLMTMPDFYPGDLDPCTPLPEFRDGLPADTSGRRTLLYEVRGGCMG
jgi:arabinofuranosyltransferase